jgi:hypothetical protein
MKGIDIINISQYEVEESSCKETIIAASTLCHSQLLEIHSRALAAHCECLAMNSDNCVSASLGAKIQYTEVDYYNVLKKWSIIDEKGKPLI